VTFSACHIPRFIRHKHEKGPAFKPLTRFIASSIIPLMPDTLSQRLAGITLPDAFGKSIRLGSLWENNPAILVFLRHYG